MGNRKTGSLKIHYAQETDNLTKNFQCGGVEVDWEQINAGIHKAAENSWKN